MGEEAFLRGTYTLGSHLMSKTVLLFLHGHPRHLRTLGRDGFTGRRKRPLNTREGKWIWQSNLYFRLKKMNKWRRKELELVILHILYIERARFPKKSKIEC